MPAAESYGGGRVGLADEHNGRRGLCDEKPFVTELSKLFHVVKAEYKERRNRRRAVRDGGGGGGETSAYGATLATTAGATLSTSPQPPPQQQQQQQRHRRRGGGGGGARLPDKKQRTPQRRASSRVSKAGGSVWVLLKGGFAAVPTSTQTRLIAHKAAVRARLSVRARIAALERAEAYVQSAWQQAREAALVVPASGPSSAAAVAATGVSGEAVSEEGLQYLQEQYRVAAAMLQPEPVGTRLRHVVRAHSGGGDAAEADGALDDLCLGASPGRRRLQQQQQQQATKPLMPIAAWHDVWRREYIIQHGLCTSDAQAQAETALRAALSAKDSSVVAPDRAYFFAIAEPSGLPREGHNAEARDGNDAGAPSRCIVRIRNSQRMKRTTVLHRPKDVNHFVSNFMQVVRRELASSRLPRGPDEGLGDEAGGRAVATASQHVDAAAATQKSGARGGGGNNNKNTSSNSSNARRRR